MKQDVRSTPARRARAARLKLADDWAEVARVVLDDLILGRNDPDLVLQRDQLLRLALQRYRIEHPKKSPRAAFFVVTHSCTPEQARVLGRWRSKDTFCLFCGCKVEARVRDPGDASTKHGLQCALMYLAGMIEAVEPGTQLAPVNALDLPLFAGLA